jgi:hypothetical protein
MELKNSQGSAAVDDPKIQPSISHIQEHLIETVYQHET